MIPTNAANQDSIRIIVDRFALLSVGDVIDYPTLRLALGFDIRARRYLIPRAIRLFNRETGGIIESVRSVGYQRLSANEYAGSISARRGRGRRIFQRAHTAFSQAVAKANDTVPAAVTRELAVIGLLAHMSRDSVAKKATVSDKPPSHADVVRRTLEAFNRSEARAS